MSPRSGNSSSTLLRGLTLLQRVSLADRPIRFSELREILPGATDTTISRLLQVLESEGYLKRAETSGYEPGDTFLSWIREVSDEDESFQSVAEKIVRKLCRASNESTAIAVFEGNRLRVVASETAEGAISVIRPNETLHFEGDHAGSLAALSLLTKPEQNDCIGDRYSRIGNAEELENSLSMTSEATPGPIFRDHSLSRPGICRIACPFQAGTKRGSLFFCLTETQADHQFDTLSDLLVLGRSEPERANIE